MKPVPLFITYIIGFIIFYKIMLLIGFEQKFFSLFFSNKNGSIQTEKIGDFLTPEGAAKPLTLTKQEIGRNTWSLLHSIAAKKFHVWISPSFSL